MTEHADAYKPKGDPKYLDKNIEIDGQKATSALLRKLRENIEQYIVQAELVDPEDGQTFRISDAIKEGKPFIAVLHDHVDYTTLYVRWWTGWHSCACKYKIVTGANRFGACLDFQLAWTEHYSDFMQWEEDEALRALRYRMEPSPHLDERLDFWWSLHGRTDRSMLRFTLLPGHDAWMQL